MKMSVGDVVVDGLRSSGERGRDYHSFSWTILTKSSSNSPFSRAST
jgi:hypothetical protein